MIRWILLAVVLATCTVSTASADDMRTAARKARADREAAEAAAREARERILEDRTRLLAEVRRLEARQQALEQEIDGLERERARMTEREGSLSEAWAQKELEFREVTGTVRVAARDLETILKHSPFTAEDPSRLDRVRPLLEKKHFPGISDLRTLVDLTLQEAERAGEVTVKARPFVNRSGQDVRDDVLTLGKFTAVYDTGEEIGFLRYQEESRRFYALSALPSWHVRRNLAHYIGGDAEAVYIDLSGGAALRQITQRPGLREQIRSGGPIVWPILAIAVIAFALVVERIVYLRGVHGNTDRIMARVNRLAEQGRWEECEATVRNLEDKGWPVINILQAGLASRRETRETQESILEEAILREAPRLERFLAVLGILGGIAPLLGLLGTVTGMISTFRVITLYGTGDPRMMSGGISEALVTTELGLAVAIPIMLCHTFLSRRVDRIIEDMQEKAVALSNICQKGRTAHGAPPQDA